MPRKSSPCPKVLSRAVRLFERWRRRREARRIPDVLWKRAAALACRYGASRTAQALGLNYARLKAHSANRRLAKEPDLNATFPFVELLPAGNRVSRPGGPGTGCVVEFERPDGGKMRVELRRTAFRDVAGLSRVFWDARG